MSFGKFMPRLAMTAAAAALIVAAVGVAVPATPALAQGNPPAPRTITVTGSGDASGEPDTAFVSVGTEVVDADPTKAFSKANEGIAALLKAMRELRIEDKDIQTSTVNIYSQTPPSPDGRMSPDARQYVASIQINIRVRNAGAANGESTNNRVGEVIDAAIKAGANSLGGVTFGISDLAALNDKARDAAIADARARAAKIAATIGVTLGEIVSVEEFAGSPVPAADLRYSGGGATGAQVNLGQLSTSYQVRIVYAIK